MPLTGTQYNYGYNHQRKEIIITFQVGTMQPVQIVMSAEAFLQDLDFIRKDKKLAHFLAEVGKRKDLPVDHDFGAGGSEIKFDPKEWQERIERD